jgi:hypothetical protein
MGSFRLTSMSWEPSLTRATSARQFYNTSCTPFTTQGTKLLYSYYAVAATTRTSVAIPSQLVSSTTLLCSDRSDLGLPRPVCSSRVPQDN